MEHNGTCSLIVSYSRKREEILQWQEELYVRVHKGGPLIPLSTLTSSQSGTVHSLHSPLLKRREHGTTIVYDTVKPGVSKVNTSYYNSFLELQKH